MNSLLIALVLALSPLTMSSFEFEVQRKLECYEEYQAKAGDILSVFYEAYSQDGTKFNSTDGSTPLNIILGSGQLVSDWEDVLEGRCAGEQVVVVKDSSLYYIMDIGVITRLSRHHSPSSRHYGIVSPDTRECDPAVVIGPGSQVTMNTVARVPNLSYLKYSEDFPTSNIPTKISRPGSRGVKVDESQDTVILGSGQVIPGWELGLYGGCEGERRMIMMNHEMAYGQAGAFRVIPPQAALVLDVEIIKVDNSQKQISNRVPRHHDHHQL